MIDGRTNFSDIASLGLHIILQLSQLFMTYYPINDPISHSHCSSPLLSPHTRVLSSLVKHLYLSTAPPPLPQSGIPQHSPPHSYQHISSVKITNLCVCNVAAEWQSDDETNIRVRCIKWPVIISPGSTDTGSVTIVTICWWLK